MITSWSTLYQWSFAEHCFRMQNRIIVLLKVRVSDLKLNENKFQFSKESIVFVRHIISSEGIWVGSSKIDAITNLSVLQSLSELQTCLGMINCPGKLIPNLPEFTAPLKTIFTKVVVINLQKPQLNAIEKLKNLIASAFVLKMIDPNLPLRLKIDVKSKGLEPLFEQNQGSLGSQKLHPIEHSSHDLRDYKKWFAYIERTTDYLYSPWSETFPRMFTWS